jgi:TRAP-type uncharacterized transport system fused permease subunit
MLILLILSAATSLLLGMGMTTSACYLILAIMVAPTLVKFGLPLMSAHLFILYFGCLSAITPPVAPASYAGAALAGSDPMRTGYLATRWGAIAYIVPFFFVYQPALILIGGVVEVIQAMLTSIVGVVLFAAMLQGYVFRKASPIQRLLLGAGGLLMIYPGWKTDLAGAIIGGIVILRQFFAWRKMKRGLA